MKKEDLINKYPEYFKNCRDFSIDDGWIPLVDMFMKCAVLDEQDFEIYVVKEKFGFLNIYWWNSDMFMTEKRKSFIFGIDKVITEMSINTCEFCGTNQHIGKTKGWIKHLCKKCAKKWWEERINELSFEEYWIPNIPLLEQRKNKLSKLD